jgi:hypothetical protein
VSPQAFTNTATTFLLLSYKGDKRRRGFFDVSNLAPLLMIEKRKKNFELLFIEKSLNWITQYRLLATKNCAKANKLEK